MQIIVIDDASNDGTAAWLKTQKDVQVIQGEGWGKPWGVNQAMSLAKGTYLRFLDSDDWLNPGTNEAQFKIAELEQSDVVVAGVDVYWDDDLFESTPWVDTDDFIAQQLGESPYSHYSAFLFKRDYVKDIQHRTLFPSSDFASRDDRCFMLEVALGRPRIVVYPKPALCHRHHRKGRLQFNGGLRADGSNIQHLYIYRQILNLLNRRGELTQRRKQAAVKVLWPLAHWIAYSHLEDGCEVAQWVFELVPDFQPPELGLLGWLYKSLGFQTTEKILRARRAVITPFRKKTKRLSQPFLSVSN